MWPEVFEDVIEGGDDGKGIGEMNRASSGVLRDRRVYVKDWEEKLNKVWYGQVY